MQTKNILITLAALTRVEYQEVVQVPADMDDDELTEFVDERYEQVDAGQFKEDSMFFEKGECHFSPAPAGAVATVHFDGVDVIGFTEATDSPGKPGVAVQSSRSVNTHLIHEAIAALSQSHPVLADEIEKLLSYSELPPTIVISRDSTGEIHTLADKRVNVAFMDGASELGEYKSGILEEVTEPGGVFKKCLHAVEVTDIDFALKPFGIVSNGVVGAIARGSLETVNGMVFVGNDETKQAMIAALHYWKEQGMCEPTERSDELHDLATDFDQLTSASVEDIDALISQLKHMPSARAFYKRLGTALTGIETSTPIVVVEIKGGAFSCIRSSEPMDVVTVDYDTNGLDEGQENMFNGETAVVGLSEFRSYGPNRYEGISPSFCLESRNYAAGLTKA